MVFHNNVHETGINALAILLRRLAYPNRWKDLCHLFGHCPSDLCIIFYGVLGHVHDNFIYLLTDLNAPYWLSPPDLQIYAQAVSQRGSPLTNIWGFIDGTARPCCRPGFYQRVMFSGHKGIHCIKFQSIKVPNGLTANLFGPMEGSRHDARMLYESGIMPVLENNMNDAHGHPFSVYGDPAYPLRVHLICPFRGAVVTPQQEQFNAAMSTVRQSVEWGFQEVVTNFAFVDFRKNLKILLQPIGKFYLVATLFANCKACLYGNQTSQYFGLDPPSLESYLGNTR